MKMCVLMTWRDANIAHSVSEVILETQKSTASPPSSYLESYLK